MNESQLSSYIEEILKSKKLKEGTCGYSQDGDIDPENTDKLTPAGPSIQEALSPEVLKRAELIKNTIVGKNRDKIVKKYGPEAEKVIHGRAITQAKQQIEKEQDTEEIEEVSSEKQRKYMCAVSQPGAKRPKGLSQSKAKEMCSDTALSKKKLQEDIIEKTDFVLPRGKKMILQAEDEDYNRGLIVELTNEGGYKMNYWYGDDAEVYPVEVLVDGQEIKPDAKEVYMKFHPELKENKTMANTRLQELIKSALMKEASTDKYDDNPALKGKQSDLPDGLQKAIIKKSGGKVNETRDSKIDDLVYKLHYAVGGADQLLKELIVAMSTDDAMLYLSAIAQDYGVDIETGERESGTMPAFEKKRMAEEILKELRGNVNENFLSKIGTKIKDKIKNLSIFDKLADKIVSKMSKEDIANFKSKFNLNEDKSVPSVEDIFDKVHSSNPDKNVNEISKIEDENSIAFKVAKLVKNLTGLNLLALGGAPLGAGIAMLMPFFPGGVIVGGLISLIASVIIHNISRKLVGAGENDELVGE